MKKLLAILLALTMIFAFAACGSTPSEEDVRGEQNVNTTQANTPTEDTNEPAGDVIDTPAGDTNEPSGDVIDTPTEEATEPTEETTEAEFSLGDVQGLNYENAFIGIGCNLPSDWTFYTDEQIRELNNMTLDLAGEEFEAAITNAQLIYDMCAVSNDQLKTINVNLEKIDPVTLAMIDLADVYQQNTALVKQGLENMGYSDLTFDYGTVMIEDETFACMRTTAQYNGATMYQLGFATKCNGYIANFTIATFNENTVDDVLSYFYLIK